MMNAPICLQWRTILGGNWQTVEYFFVPVAHPTKLRIDFTPAIGISDATKLIDAINQLVQRVGGRTVEVPIRAAFGPPSVGPLIEADEGDSLLEVIVSDGATPFAFDQRLTSALAADAQAWVLPLMPDHGRVDVLPQELRRQNVAFWKDCIDELALTVLARAGVTSLDRRVFISYRRIETEPMAGQLFEVLTGRNFSVFLDTISVDPGVDFQARLFEQLADKSLVLLLHSETFSQSRWTMAEINYTRERALSLSILRLPSVQEGDALEQQYRAGDVLRLARTDLVAPATTPPYRLTDSALTQIVDRIMQYHDIEMINRIALLRQRTLQALETVAVEYEQSRYGASVFARSNDHTKTYRLFPTSRPPGLPELFDASIFTEAGDRRIVVGNISSFNRERIRQMDWTVDGRNVAYADVTILDAIAQKIKSGVL
jgi:hypothetical protein